MTLEPSTGTAAFTPSCGAASEASLLRFMTCGSVDDGKSTLIGRLLLDGNLLHEDQLVALRVDSVTTGTRGGALDCALLLDGLAAEREQGITIDVAYRYFATPQRKFIVADAPGHEQFTRNMVTGASTADLAIVLIDARKGVLPQTRRHSYLASLLGIRQVVLAVNKMDLVAYAQDTFEAIRAEYLAFATRLGIAHVTAIPVCAVDGDNVVASPSRNMPWYTGPALMQHLEAVEVDQARAQRAPFRMPVQSVHRPDSGFRGFAGCLASGGIAPGARVRVAHSGKQSRIDRIVSSTGDLDSAVASQSVMLTLTDELDIARGDMLCSDLEPAASARQFEATLVWMGEQPMLRGRTYLLKAGTKTVVATVTPLKYKINVESLEHVAATTLALNEIGVVGLELDRPIAFDPYVENRDTGSFILIDRMSHDTVAAGLVHFALRRDENIHWQALGVSRAARQAMNQHGSGVVWFTGLSGAGKSALANELERALHAMGHRTYLLDGDNLRHGLNKDLGFTAADRVENIRRVAEVAKLMADAGLIVLTAFISPFSAERQMARELIGNDAFVEVFVDAPLAVAEARDTKGLYRKARRGELVNFTGIDSPYEAPKTPDLRIDTTCVSVSSAAALIMQRLQAMGIAIKS